MPFFCRGFSCSKLYRGCRDYPSHYRNPAVDISNGNLAIGRGKTGTSSKGNPVKEENGSVPGKLVFFLERKYHLIIYIYNLFLNQLCDVENLPKGSRKKSSSLNGRAIKALPPPLGLIGHRTLT